MSVGGSITGEHGVGLEKRDLMPLLFSDDDLDVMLSLRNAFNRGGRAESGQAVSHDAGVRRNARAVAESGAASGGHVSATGVSLDVARELRAICGEEYVTTRRSRLRSKGAEC